MLAPVTPVWAVRDLFLAMGLGAWLCVGYTLLRAVLGGARWAVFTCDALAAFGALLAWRCLLYTSVRIILDTVAECYNALGVIHDMYHPIPSRFKDYISTPKPNMYQSLHTTVIGHEGIPFEVQIRTWEMDQTAEYGVAAHWKYKAGLGGKAEKLDDRVAWVRQLLESQRDSDDAGDLLREIKSELLPEEVFAFTPKGDVINLPAGATAIDFAYAIHSAVGNRMVGAKVDGRIVPIDHKVNTGEIIEVLTGPQDKGCLLYTSRCV